jgi:hypothetical protein
MKKRKTGKSGLAMRDGYPRPDERNNVHSFEDIGAGRRHGLARRSFLRTAGMVAAETVSGGLVFPAITQESDGTSAKPLVNGRRKLGQLEVSSVGLGCQDMTGTFYATPHAARRAIALRCGSTREARLKDQCK